MLIKIVVFVGGICGLHVLGAAGSSLSGRTYKMWAEDYESRFRFTVAERLYASAACAYRIRGDRLLADEMSRKSREMFILRNTVQDGRASLIMTPRRDALPIDSRVLRAYRPDIPALPVPQHPEYGRVAEPVAEAYRSLPLAPEQTWVVHATPQTRVTFTGNAVRTMVPTCPAPTRPAPRRPDSQMPERAAPVVMHPLLAAHFVPLRTSRADIPVHRDEESESEESVEALPRRDEDPEPGAEMVQAWLLGEIVIPESPAVDPAADHEMLARSRGFFEEE